jgi:hypothetical protein
MKRLDGRFRVSDTSSRPSSTTENLERSPIQGRRFRFTIDLDDDTDVVEGASIAGSTVTATFATTGDIVAVMADAGGNDADWSAVPEPNTVALLLAGLTGLAWGGRRR